MEPKMGQIANIEKARVGAEAELAYRDAHSDVFKLGELTEAEMASIASIADKFATKAMDEYKEEAPVVAEQKVEVKPEEQVGEQKENQEKMLVQKMIELIKTNPDLDFIVSANGNFIDMSHSTTGNQHDYFFNKEKQKMDYLFNGKKDFHSLDSILSDIQSSGPSLKDLALFTPYWSFHQDWKYIDREKVALPYIMASARFPINAFTNNPYCEEHRPGTHLSFALRYPNKQEFLDTLKDKEMETYLKNPGSAEGRKFFGDLIYAVAPKWFPEYWDFFLTQNGLHKKYNENMKKQG
jgi:hypothetical protein